MQFVSYQKVNTTERMKSHWLESHNFDIRKHCFICGKANSQKYPVTSITTGSGNRTRDKVLKAATEREDETVRMRMIYYEDYLPLMLNIIDLAISIIFRSAIFQLLKLKQSLMTVLNLTFQNVVNDLEQKIGYLLTSWIQPKDTFLGP